jgi:PPM family protein phosphatase
MDRPARPSVPVPPTPAATATGGDAVPLVPVPTAAAAGATRVVAGGASHAGRVRAVNQDAFWLGEVPGKGFLAIVADGMGGHQTGEVASRQAVEVFRAALKSTRSQTPAAMARAAQTANLEVHAAATANPAHHGMGTTLTALVVDDQVGLIGHVGDSRAYRLRDGVLSQLTHDHSWVADRVRQGLLTADEARRHRWRNVITNALGATETFRLDLGATEVRTGDRFLLCSDGVSMLVSEGLMGQILADHPPKAAAELLIAEANDRGAPDNVTALVVHVELVAPRPKGYDLPEELDEPTSVEVRGTQSGIREVEEAFPSRSPLRALRKHPWYPYRGWVVGSLYLVLLFLVFSLWRG